MQICQCDLKVKFVMAASQSVKTGCVSSEKRKDTGGQKLEYGNNPWSPYTVKHRKLLGDVQRRATKFILSYPLGLSYMYTRTELTTLGTPQREFRLATTVFFKSRNGLIITNIYDYLCTSDPRYKTCNYDPNNYSTPCVSFKHIYRSGLL